MVKCNRCLFWIRDEKLRASVCYFKSKVITRRDADQDMTCPVYVSHLEVCGIVARVADARHGELEGVYD